MIDQLFSSNLNNTNVGFLSFRWSNGPDGCRQTLLHRAIDENNESVACFLIKRYEPIEFYCTFFSRFVSNCDINSPRQAGLSGETPDICKTLESPLHLGKR
jgi:hypothetical protein